MAGERDPSPKVTVQAFGDGLSSEKLGSSVAQLIYSRVAGRTERFGVDLVSGQTAIALGFMGEGDETSETKVDLQALQGASGIAGAAVALINLLTSSLPRRRFRVAGELQPQGAEGVGISLELSSQAGDEVIVPLWAESFELHGRTPVDAYQQLAVPAAACVDMFMARDLGADALLTFDQESWAFFRTGLDAQRLGDTKRAALLYEQALAADGANAGALANLGVIHRGPSFTRTDMSISPVRSLRWKRARLAERSNRRRTRTVIASDISSPSCTRVGPPIRNPGRARRSGRNAQQRKRGNLR